MNYTEEYNKKLTTPQEAVKVVGDGDLVRYAEHTLFPFVMDEALSEVINNLQNVAVKLVNPPILPKVIEKCQDRSRVAWVEGHFNGIGRKCQEKKIINFNPGTYSHQGRCYRELQKCDVVFLQASPMDKHGYFNFGVAASGHSAMIDSVKKAVVVEENPAIPVCFGGEGECIHISKVDYIVEGINRPLLEIPDKEPNEAEKTIAKLLIEQIPNGACLQLGIGGLPNAVGNLICESDIVDLGVHTEMLTQAYYNMYQAGKITGKYKTIDRGKMVFTFAMGQKKFI